MNESDYRNQGEALLAHVEATVDRWLEDDLIDIDAHRSGGLLELSLPDRSRIVINLQPPLQEVWLAARSGGYHYRLADGRWIDREGAEFFATLSRCLGEQAGRSLRVEGTSACATTHPAAP